MRRAENRNRQAGLRERRRVRRVFALAARLGVVLKPNIERPMLCPHLFRTGEAILQPDGEAALTLLAKEILPVARKGCSDSPLKWEAIYIEGHTDNIPIRTSEFASNWQLASARAIRTFNALTVSQPDLGTLRNHQQKAVFGISGYGEPRPVAGNTTEEGSEFLYCSCSNWFFSSGFCFD